MDHKLSALVVDDEEGARRLLKALLEETLSFSEVRSADSASSALLQLADFEPDIIFLDIKMPGRDGFSLLEELKQTGLKSQIVFTTAYDNFAIKAIKNDAFDYLLKPVSRPDLEETIRKYVMKVKEHNEASESSYDGNIIHRIRINTRSGTLFVNPESVLYCVAEGNYTTIHTGDKQLLCSMNLGKLQKELPGKRFIRIGRSHIINFEFVAMIDRKHSTITLAKGGESFVLKIPRHHIKDLDKL